MASAKPRVKVPASAAKGEIIEIKSLISHTMESGQRKDKEGKAIPRKIINKFIVTFNGKEFFSADWAPAISANPFLSFHMRAEESGTMGFTWIDDDGSKYTAEKNLKVT
ncbi:MAG: thiosulfate oxidation carrier complex protein SoxZ [Alphaproteobacteria bacterium]|nr:thiosulfate oxidation carrier complex protein SoxZ [Alphaproteobacteria bacterium]